MKNHIETFVLIFLLLSALGTIASSPWEGFDDRWGNYVPGYVTNETWMESMPEYVSGKAVFFGPYAMDATAEYRGINYEDEGCLGGVSLMSPYNIGDKAWVKINSQWYGPFCVVDCAKKGDIYSIVVYREEVIEINFELAVEVGMVSEHVGGNYEVYNWYKDVEVLVNKSPYEYSFEEDPVVYVDYFLDNLKFATGFEPRILVIEEGKVWKEYAGDKYWIKEEPEPEIVIPNFIPNSIDMCFVPNLALDKTAKVWYNIFSKISTKLQ